MLQFLSIFFIFILASGSNAEIKDKVIKNLINTDNLNFNFEQNINGKIENGSCIIEYPKKIYCKYNLKNQKILVSNGQSLVIKTINGFYQYSLKKTPLNFILNKEYLINKVNIIEESIVDKSIINFKFTENDNEIIIFFDKKTHNLIGWQTLDIYQNLSTTYLSSIIKNDKIDKEIFKIPNRN